MFKADKIKILVLGPVSTGKTYICNYLGDAAENATGDGRPTKGVRIVEFTVDGFPGKVSQKTDVELWDCSGDTAYEHCWPAMRHDAGGIIFVYDDDTAEQREALRKMRGFFVESCGFPERKCTVWRNRRGDVHISEKENPLAGIDHAVVDLGEKDHELRKTFNFFLKNLGK